VQAAPQEVLPGPEATEALHLVTAQEATTLLREAVLAQEATTALPDLHPPAAAGATPTLGIAPYGATEQHGATEAAHLGRSHPTPPDRLVQMSVRDAIPRPLEGTL